MQDPGHPAGIGDLPISASTWLRGRRVLPRASRAASAVSWRWALARVWSNPRAWRAWRVGEWVRITRRVAPERGGGGLDRGQPAEAGLVHELVAAAGMASRSGCSEGGSEPTKCSPSPARWSWLAAELWPASKTTVSSLHAAGELLVAGDQLVDDGGELGDVGPVARVGVGDQRDPAVAGDHQRQADQAQVVAFLLGLAALGDRRLVVGRVDEGGEVGHVQHQPGQVQAEPVRPSPAEPALDLGQLRR